MMPPIDVDDPGTWPPRVHKMVLEWAERLRGTTRYTGDLALPLQLEEPFRALFADHLVRAYHYTKLLPHEWAMILKAGLRPLSADLLFDRINAAVTAGVTSAEESSCLHRAHVFATGEEQNRAGQVCFVLSKHVFARDPEACLPLLTTWGGEGMYMSSGAVPIRERLMKLGVPAVVTALLDLAGSNRRHLIFPALHKVFVGAALGLSNRGADIFYKSAVAPENIESILKVNTTLGS